jgi:hypothetical protein
MVQNVRGGGKPWKIRSCNCRVIKVEANNDRESEGKKLKKGLWKWRNGGVQEMLQSKIEVIRFWDGQQCKI